MLMRLVRDEPDVQLDEILAVGAESDATVLNDLRSTVELASRSPQSAGLGGQARKARMRMSSKSLSQVIEVPEFGSESADLTPDVDCPQTGVPSEADMTDGSIPPEELPQRVGENEEASADEDLTPISLPTLEALLLTTHHPLTPARLSELLEAGSHRAIRAAIQTLNESYEQTARCFRIEQVAGGYQILTLPEFGDTLRRLHLKEADAKLTKAALETLSIIAYKQPILRADVEAIRGVQCGETIRSLMEKHLVKIAGRAEEPGRPILYGTTKRFLELFGLNSLKDLPKPEDFKPATT